MRIEKTPLTLTILLIFFSISAQTQTYQQLNKGEIIKGEQSYILPKTTFVIEIPVVTTTVKRTSAYVDYDDAQLKVLENKYGVDAEIYRSLKGADANKPFTKTTTIIAEDSVKIKWQSAPDLSKVFYISSSSKWNKNQTVTFTYGADGILTDGESLREDKTFDIVVKGVSGLVSVAGALFKSGDNLIKTGDVPDKNNVVIGDLDDIIRKYSVLELQVNYDIYKDLKATYEKKYTAIFEDKFYSEKKKSRVIKVIYTPAADTRVGTEINLFDLEGDKIKFDVALASQLSGMNVETANLSGKPYRIKIVPVKPQQMDVYQHRPTSNTGIAFNIPMRAAVALINKKDVVFFHEETKIAQLGIIGYTNTRKEKLVFSLDPGTGELKKLTIEGKAVLTDQVGSVASTVTDAAKLIKAEDADTALEKEVKRLENEKKKRDLLKELENK